MKCIVTGGAGFIGSHISDFLISEGHQVIIIDSESAVCNDKFFWNPKCVKVVEDVANYDKIEPLFDGIDWVFHLAADARIQPAIENPTRTALTNVVGTCNVLQASKINNVGKVIYSSTSSAYGLKNSIPLQESMPNDCLNPYSVTKVAGEDLCRMYYRLFNLNTIILRYFNVYGARQPLRGQYAPVVGIFLRQFFDNKPMTVVGDGEQRRDFTHVNDVVNANYLAATIENQNVFGETFNIGSGTSYSILDLVKIIGGEYKHIDERLGEARETLADIAKAQNLLGWEPTVELSSWLERSRNGELSW
jgi:UDP-glucose 4-epimerase